MQAQAQLQLVMLSTNLNYMPQSMLSSVGTCQEAVIDTAAGGTVELIAATASQTIRIYKIFVYANSANNLTFKDGSTNLMGVINLNANSGFVVDPDANGHCPYTLTAGNAFNMTCSAASQVSGRVWFIQE